MSYTTAAEAINQWIVQNGNNEITADVLRPVLLEILQAAKETTGELINLGTPTQDNLVAAINYLLSIIPPGSAGVKVYTGIPDPNVTPPPSFQYADFYMQVTSENIPIQLWQWNGNDWVVVSYGGGGGSQNLQQTLENGQEAELDIKFPFDSGLGTVFEDENVRFGFLIGDRAVMHYTDKNTGRYAQIGTYAEKAVIDATDADFLGLEGLYEYAYKDLPTGRRTYYAQVGYVDDAIAAAGGGATNLSYTPSPTDGTVNSDTGTDATIPLADGTNAGLLSPAMKTKVDGIASGATANTGTVTTVSVVTANGVTGSVANASTTPAITLSLGAITPTTVVASGNVTAPNIDSTNKTDIAARELLSNKSDNGALGSSTSLYPTQRAVKEYADNINASAWQGLGNTAVNNNMVLGTTTNFNWSIVRNNSTMLAFNNNAIGVGGSVFFTGGNVANNGQLGIGSTTTAFTYSRNLPGSLDLTTYTDLHASSTGRFAVFRSNVGGTVADRAAILRTGQMEIADATAANQAMTLGQLGTVNNSTVALTNSALNAAYPNVNVGFMVQAPLITTGAMIYVKNTEAGSSDVWLSIVATVTP